MRLYHGTTSAMAEAIVREGLRAPAYLSPDLDGALHYASCGGEWDLQDREEAYHAAHGEWPRDLYETVELHRRMYPEGETPTVVAFDVPDGAAFRPDDGAEGGLVSDTSLPAAWVAEVVTLEWDPDDMEYPRPSGTMPNP